MTNGTWGPQCHQNSKRYPRTLLIHFSKEGLYWSPLDLALFLACLLAYSCLPIFFFGTNMGYYLVLIEVGRRAFPNQALITFSQLISFSILFWESRLAIPLPFPEREYFFGKVDWLFHFLFLREKTQIKRKNVKVTLNSRQWAVKITFSMEVILYCYLHLCFVGKVQEFVFKCFWGNRLVAFVKTNFPNNIFSLPNFNKVDWKVFWTDIKFHEKISVQKQVFPNIDNRKILLSALIQKNEYLELIQNCPICTKQPEFRISG